jgi:competence protein ComGC/uncharacterized protein YutE (UPF0331/DUF86 family)
MKNFSIYKVISVLAFIALIFILALPNFFNINQKQETEQCIKNMKAVYSGAEEFLRTENKDFHGTTSDLERMGYLNKAYECPAEAPGDKYQIRIKAETGEISVRCINEINSSPDLSVNAFEDFVYFVNILKFHQKPTSEFIYNKLSEEVKELLDDHEAYSNSLFDTRSILDWEKFVENLNTRHGEAAVREVWQKLSESSKDVIKNWHRVENPLTVEQKYQITSELNDNVIVSHEFSRDLIKSMSLGKEGEQLYEMGYAEMNQIQKQRFNRIMLELIFPYEFQVSSKYNYPSDELQEELVDDLNRLLRENAFNEPAFINEIKLSGNTVEKLEKQPGSQAEIALTNRLLLEDAYPTLLVEYEDQYSDHRLPRDN